MLFSVIHETLYRYSVPVGLAPHCLRLNPRAGVGRVLSRRLVVDPHPMIWRDIQDDQGNLVTEVEFSGTSAWLRIESQFELETWRPAPLPAWGALPPLPWPGIQGDGLDRFRQEHLADPSVTYFAQTLVAQSHSDPMAFLDHLCQTLFVRTDRQIRFEGDAQTPAHTLASARGACRDLTVLFLAACRGQGMAGRFVSGYQAEADTPDGQRHLHAWPEIFLPGYGLAAWDPTHGIAVGEGHVPLYAAATQAETMPVEGGFYANGVTATLDYSVRIATS